VIIKDLNTTIPVHVITKDLNTTIPVHVIIKDLNTAISVTVFLAIKAWHAHRLRKEKTPCRQGTVGAKTLNKHSHRPRRGGPQASELVAVQNHVTK
jgi:hypothetical protein